MQAVKSHKPITQVSPTGEGNRLSFGWLAAIFVASLALNVWFNFCDNHVNAHASCDASEYLRNAGALSQLSGLPAAFWTRCLACLTGFQEAGDLECVRAGLKSLAEMHQSAPVFPLFILASFAAFGVPFDAAVWAPPLLFQSLLGAAACVCIALTGAQAWGKHVGIVAGLLSLTYPAFIVNSGRLYSESFATFLTCLVLYLTVRGFSDRGNGQFAHFLLGLAASSLQLTRSATVVIAALLFPLVYLQNRQGRPWLSMIFLALGFTVVLLPWLALQSLTWGRSSLVVDRVGHYNLFIGTNVDTAGWLSYPYPDGRGIEDKTYIQLTRESVKTSPSRFVKLMQDKPLRLFKFPWNDFRTAIGPVTFAMQVAWHQALLLLAAIGAGLALFVEPRGLPPTARQLYARALVVGLILFHAVYLIFITVPRYNLTAMPAVILLAGAGAVTLARLIRRNPRAGAPWLVLASSLLLYACAKVSMQWFHTLAPGIDPRLAVGLANALSITIFAGCLGRALSLTSGHQVLARLSCAGLAVLLAVVLCVPARANGRWWEVETTIEKPGQSVTQEIRVPQAAMSPSNRQFFLMIDADGTAGLTNGLSICVNGTRLYGPLIPGLALAQDLSTFKRLGNGDLYLECEYIFECLAASGGFSNQDLRQWYLIPIPAGITGADRLSKSLQVCLTKTSEAPTRLFAGIPTAPHVLEMPAYARHSWEKAFYGVENDHGLTDTRYDVKLPAENAERSTSYFIRLLESPGQCTDLPPIKATIEQVRRADERTVFSAKLPSVGNELLVVRVSGKVKSLSDNAAPALAVRITGKSKDGHRLTYPVPWAPRRLDWKNGIATVDFSFPFLPAALPGTAEKVEIDLASKARPGASFAGLAIEFLTLSKNPLARGHEVF